MVGKPLSLLTELSGFIIFGSEELWCSRVGTGAASDVDGAGVGGADPFKGILIVAIFNSELIFRKKKNKNKKAKRMLYAVGFELGHLDDSVGF